MQSPTNRIRVEDVKGKKVQIYLLPALEGMVMAKTLANVVIPTVGTFYQGMADGDLNLERVAQSLVTEAADLEIAEITMRLLRELSIDGQQVDFDDYFMGNYGELVEVLAFALKENFASFFEAKGLFEKYLPRVEQEQATAE